jgi:hypothetical protein
VGSTVAFAAFTPRTFLGGFAVTLVLFGLGRLGFRGVRPGSVRMLALALFFADADDALDPGSQFAEQGGLGFFRFAHLRGCARFQFKSGRGGKLSARYGGIATGAAN